MLVEECNLCGVTNAINCKRYNWYQSILTQNHESCLFNRQAIQVFFIKPKILSFEEIYFKIDCPPSSSAQTNDENKALNAKLIVPIQKV